ncbi:two-component system QseEF-associated lipoprotein QseG [Acerihabitans sp. TG2]|uniref:two-component system QseEF-associated lipoprotein QseG n=1 Tax=Acerihabitans sp. TG2 TaxID=3096008 RepID=UPI002B226600|nr:two-component system QseEF-associated lipoprotein QseG [Acerihabitans sp. TG2]MEA9392451.1 two-component system QseEF-associated lipoprotein QseG [Acerihabitans sp. TG2]
MTLCNSSAIYRLVSMLHHPFKDVVRTRSGRSFAPLCCCLLLLGCSSQSVRTGLGSTSSLEQHLATPGQHVAECRELWHTDDQATLADARYWLRAMQCAERITPTQARLLAAEQDGETWYEAFRQSLLLNSAGISVIERRESYQHLLGFRSRFPAAVYPLFRMWRQQQALRLMLAEARSHNQQQAEASAAQIEQMRIQQIELQRKLDVTSRKLENLTEIERRLSARKQQLAPDMPDNDDTASSPTVPAKTPSTTGHGAGVTQQGAGSQ